MKNRVLGVALAGVAAMAGLGGGIAQQPAYRDPYEKVPGGQPYRGESGMAHGTKVRGNRNVKRHAAKRSNVARNRRAHRG